LAQVEGPFDPVAATCFAMAPPANAMNNHLKASEEEWRDLFNNLCARFPGVQGQKVAQVLRDRNGHGGEASAFLRDMTSSVVKEPDPDDVEHVATLLSSAAMFKHACKENFKKFDINKDGALEWDEVKALTNNLYDEFGLQAPSEGSLKAFFLATDENQDGVLSEREFRKFFEMFLRYAFFDHLKLRQVVEKGKAIEEQRASVVGLADGRDDAERDSRGSTPAEDSRGSSASSSSKPDKRKKSHKSAQRAGEEPRVTSPGSGYEKSHKSGQRERDHTPQAEPERPAVRCEKSGQRERGRTPPAQAERPLGTAMRCVAANGVAYRASPDFQDRTNVSVGNGETVRVLEHWIRTPSGWLPVTDTRGQNLFETSNAQATAVHSDESVHNQKKHVSIRHKDNQKEQKDDVCTRSIEHNQKEQQEDVQLVSVRSSPSPCRQRQLAPVSEVGGLTPNEEDWRPIFERLVQRFPSVSQEIVVQALRDNDGHAGKAASDLRCM